MITQYLNDEGYHSSKMTLLDEANVKWHEKEDQQQDAKRLKKSILGMIVFIFLVNNIIKQKKMHIFNHKMNLESDFSLIIFLLPFSFPTFFFLFPFSFFLILYKK